MKLIKTKIRVALFCLFSFAGIFLSCRRNPASWDTQILAPVVTANLSISNIIISTYLKNNADSTVSLVYTDSLYNLNMDTLLSIPDTVIRYDTLCPINYTVTPGGIMYPYLPDTAIYPIGSVQLKEGILQSGYLIFTVKNPLIQPVDYYFQVLNVTKNGKTLSIYVKVPPKDSLTKQIPLNGYTIDFTGRNHDGYNTIITSIQVNLDSNANTLVLHPNDPLVDANIKFENIIPYYVKGYFGTNTKTFGPEKVKFPIFNNIIAGSLNLQSVVVNLTLSNGFGVDASLLLSQLSSYNGHTNTTINLTDHGLINSTIHVNRATPTGNAAPASPVNPSVLNFSINPSNSNILQWLDNMPTSIGYALKVETDPLGNVSGSNDFAYYGYGISAALNVTIPLSLVANNLTLADTLAVNFAGSTGTTRHVKSGILTLYATNGFPFSAGLQLYLLNNKGVIYDSLFVPPQTIAAAPVNSSTGIVTSPQASVLTISLNATQAQQLYGTQKMILYARFNIGSSAPLTYRKIYDYYQLGLKLVGNFDYQIN